MKRATRRTKFSAAAKVHGNPFMEIRHTRADFGAFSKDYFVVHFGPRAGVVAVSKGKVLLVRQYRFLVNGFSWEIPGGKVESNEAPETAAARECLEETGVVCRDLEKLVVYFPGLDNVENRTTLFYTENVKRPRSFVRNAAEVEEIAWIPFQRCINMVFSEEILDALTVVGILSYAAHCAAAKR